MTVKSAEGGAEPIIVSTTELASYIDVTPSSIGDLAAKDRVVRVGRGRYDLKASVRAHSRHLREAAAGRPGSKEELNAAKARIAVAQADMAEMERNRQADIMVDVAEFEEAWAHDVVLFRQTMLGVPTEIAAALPGLTKHEVSAIDEKIRAALTRCADGVPAKRRRITPNETKARLRARKRIPQQRVENDDE